MKTRYRIAPEGRRNTPSDAEIARYRDPKRLVYNYQRARERWHRRPLYKDPRSFLALLLIVLLAWLLSDVVEREREQPAPDRQEQAP